MKKIFALLCVCSLMFGAIGCGKADDAQDSQSGSSESAPGSAENASVSGESTAESSGAAGEETNGWTPEMDAVRKAVVAALGESYWPDMALDSEMLETVFGLTPDMYDDYLAEMPMISTNVDTLVVVKAKEGQADAVEEALTAYRENLVGDTMQYPMNLGKIQASRVEKIGNYVCFVQLGADTMDTMEEGDEAVIAQCQEINELVIEIISQQAQ